MAKKYVNFRVGGSPQKVNDDYSVWTNDLLGKVIASKTVIQPGRSTVGHKLVESDVVYIIVNGRGTMEVIEYMNPMEGHGKDPSQGIEHQDSYALTQGDVILVQSGDFVKVANDSDHDQLTYMRVFDREGWRQ
ncbi:MAG: cupin [SAR86 cluster bacterium]|nr:cupin [SAR86 cluster bacterium]